MKHSTVRKPKWYGWPVLLLLSLVITTVGIKRAHATAAGAAAGTGEDLSYIKKIETVVASGAPYQSQWLRLGHWRPRGFLRSLYQSKFLSAADGDDFFISSSGKEDPAAELRATLYAFSRPLGETPGSDEAFHAQCRYPARRKWAFEHLKWHEQLRNTSVGILPCKGRQLWKEKLGAEGLSLVFASAYLGNAASMFGHTFLKFHSKENRTGRELLDYGVNFAAETGGETNGRPPIAVYGLVGLYPGRFTMQPYHQTLRTYSNLEGRDLIEYKLDFSNDELDFFIDHLFELERTHFDYYFLTENCSYFLLAAIEAARPDLELSRFFRYAVIPADTVRVVSRVPGLVTSVKYRPSLETTFRDQLATLSSTLSSTFSSTEIEFAGLLTAPQSRASVATRSGQATAAALDLAIDYGALRAAKDPSFNEINHILRSERATRAEAFLKIKTRREARPEQGHNPARVGALIELPREGESSQRRLGLQFRFAYHDRLSKDDGYLRGTTLEVLRATIFQHDEQSSWFQIREVTILEILSAEPRSLFSQPISWRGAVGFRSPAESESLGPYVGGGAGTTIGFSDFAWFTALVDGEALVHPDLENRFWLAAGPRLISTFFLHEDLKLGFEYEIKRALTIGRHVDLATLELAWSAQQNFEIRIGYRDQSTEGLRRSEWFAKIYQHLMF